MRTLTITCILFCLFALRLQGQTPPSQTMVFAGIPAVGIDYSKRLTRKKWSSEVLSITASPNFYFRRYNFDLDPGRSKFTHYRILIPVTLRFDLYVKQIVLDKVGNKNVKFGVFFDAGYAASYTLKAHLREEYFFNQNSSSPDFVFDGDIAQGSEKISFHPTVGFGMRFGRMVVYFRAITKPYQWTDRSRDWGLPKEQTSYFYSWEYRQTGAMICIGLQL